MYNIKKYMMKYAGYIRSFYRNNDKNPQITKNIENLNQSWEKVLKLSRGKTKKENSVGGGRLPNSYRTNYS